VNRAKERRGNTACVHHWVIDEFNVGRCKKCPAVKDFGALQEKDAKAAAIKIHPGTRGRPRKQE